MNKIYRLVWNSAQRAWVVAGEFSAAKGKGKNCPRRLSLKAITAGGLVLAALGTSQLANAYTVAGASLVNGGTAASDNGSTSNTAFGSSATATGFRSTAVGQSSNSVGVSSLALGDTATANGVSSIALGTNSTNTGIYTIAIGARASASSLKSAGAIALGVDSIASFDGATAIGANAESTHLNSVAIGRTTKAYGDSAVAIGDQTNATAIHSTAIGGGSKSTGSTSTSVGWYTQSSGDNALAFGNNATASATDSAVIGSNSSATGIASVAVGKNAQSSGTNSMAMGTDSEASADSAIAVGAESTAQFANSLALGNNAQALNSGSVALGSDSVTAAAVATANTTIAGKTYNFAGISPLSTVSVGGVNAERTVTNVAAGRVSGTSTDAINGSQLFATNGAINELDDRAVQYDINPDGTVNYNNVTMGGTTYNSVTKTGGTKITNVARGVADGDAVNVSQLNETNQSINNIYTTGTKYFHANSTKADSQAVGVDSIAVGPLAVANGVNSIAQGLSATANGTDAIALGRGATATSGPTQGALAIGAGTVATGNGSMALGVNSKTAGTGGNNFALGGGTAGDATTNAASNIALGRFSSASGGNAVGLGFSSVASGSYSTALGAGAVASGVNSVALGGSDVRDTSATTTVDDGVALGSYTVANTAGGVTGYLPTGATAPQIAAINATTGTLAAVSVGNAAGGVFRQINGLAAGTVDSDAVNVAQLKGAVGSATADAVMYDPGTNHNSVTLGGTTYDNSTHVGGTTITNVANGVAPSDAVNYSQLTETNTNISNIYATGTKYFHANSTGTDSVASALDSIAIGMGAVADVARSVALGDGAKTAAAVATTGATIAGTDYLFAGMAPIGTVSIGDAGAERTLTNVAAGRLSETSTDGVNGSQLFATNSAIDVLDQNAVKYDLNPDGTINYNSVTMGGDTYNSVTKTGGTKITNVARGVDDSDAVNVSQLNETNNNVTIIGDTLTNIAGDTSASYTDVHGMGIRYVRTNEAGLVASDSSAEGQGSTAVGYNATSQGESSLALGREALAQIADGVALGSKSVANTLAGIAGYIPAGASAAQIAAISATTSTLGAVSIGDVAAGEFRQINGLAAGTVDSDAVNVAQLKGAVGSATADAVMYDPGTNHNNVTLGGTTYDNSTHVGGTTITNVARGVDDSDAVNVSQLNETNNNVTIIGDTLTNIAGDTSTSYTDVHGTGIRYVRTNEAGLTASDSSAEGQGSTAVGYNATSQGESSLAMGREALAKNADDVALGSGSITDIAVGTSGAKIAGVDYAFAGTNPLSTVSVGSLGHERTITNVAAGRLSAESTDAINGSQLFATNTAIDVLDQNAVKYDLNPDGTINYNSVTMGGDTYNSVTKTGGTKITNVARGVDDSDAVNVSQLNETNTNVTNIGDTLTNIAGDTSASYTDVHGMGIRYVRTNEAGLVASDSSAEGQGSTAVGYNATSQGESSLALGREALAKNADDVALGSGSITDIAVGTSGAKIADVDYAFAGINPLSTVSVGSLGRERTITNVAAGRLSAESTDAINGSQLFATNSAINTLDKGSVKYEINNDGSVNYNSIKLAGDTYNNVTKTGGTSITNVAYGIDDSDAVNVQQLNDATTNIYNGGTKYFHANSVKADSVASGIDSIAVGPEAKSIGNGSIAMGNAAQSTGNGSMALGQNAQSVGENSVAMGVGAIASNAGDIALGAGSITAAAVATTGTTIAGNHYDFAGTAPTSTVSIGSEGAERTITNVAAGRIDANSTDAVNGSQLNATNQAIGNISGVISTIDKGSVKYETNVDGTVNYNKVVMGGDTYDNSTHTGGTTISNVAAGVNDSDAVNKHQLDQVNNSVTNIAEGKDGMFQVNNTSKLPKPKPTGKDAVAGGAGAVASADNSLTLGTSSKATHNNSVALGNNSVTDRDNSVSVGSVGGERQIANVAAGTQGTDAVNVNQLKQGVSNAYNYTDNKFNDLKNMVDDQKDKLSAGISGAMAMASLPQPYQPGASMVSMGGGTYQGESAVALGVSTISDNGKWVTKLSGTTTSQGDLGAAVGVGYQW